MVCHPCGSGQAGCEIRGDEAVRAIFPAAKPASEEDWKTEYLDAIIAVNVVDGVEEAIAHIEHYGSHHTDPSSPKMRAAENFLGALDSAIVLWNASTQFADGGEFGMGAEIGIGTGKLHARGPVGVEQLTTFKYVVRGTARFVHEALPYGWAGRPPGPWPGLSSACWAAPSIRRMPGIYVSLTALTHSSWIMSGGWSAPAIL